MIEVFAIAIILGLIAFYEKRISKLKIKQIHFKDLENNAVDSKKNQSIEKNKTELNESQIRSAEQLLGKYESMLQVRYSGQKKESFEKEKVEELKLEKYDGAFGD